MNWLEVKDILTSGGGILFIVLTLIQLSPIKIDPWTKLIRWMGRSLNTETLEKINDVSKQQEQTQKTLEAHIAKDEERSADMRREQILRFNNELLRDIPHTREDYIEILAAIDSYERYCKEHPAYQNNRAIHAIANIGRVYDERMKKHDFLSV